MTPPAQSAEVHDAHGFRDLLWVGWCEGGRAYVQGNAAIGYRTFEVHSEAFWSLIENGLIDTTGDVPRPDLVESIAVAVEHLAREGFDDVAALDTEMEVSHERAAV